MKDPNKYPPGWDAERVRQVLEYVENRTDEEAIADDEAAFGSGAPDQQKSFVTRMRRLFVRHHGA